MLSIKNITLENLESGNLREELPEFYDLKNVVEQNKWHNNQSVFDHTLAVIKKINNFKVNSAVENFLGSKIDTIGRRDVIFLGAAFHDIAKGDVLIQHDGFTETTGHEEDGYKKISSILNRISLSDREKELVSSIVRYHGFIHGIFDPGTSNIDGQIQTFKKERGAIFLYLIIMGYIDTLGSDLENSSPEEFNFRIKHYEKIFDDFQRGKE